MSLNDTPSAERIHIGFFGCRNAGKSSLVNAVTGQDLSVVSDVKGTTTDLVMKSMELLPLGPVVIIDTPGFDDEGMLGELRIRRTRQALNRADIAVLVVDASVGMTEADGQLLEMIQKRGLPWIIAANKQDLLADADKNNTDVLWGTLSGDSTPGTENHNVIMVSSKTGAGVYEFKERLGTLSPQKNPRPLLSDLIRPGDTVVLVCPIDESAPKGRLILPQQMAVRDVIDAGALAVVVRETELAQALSALKEPPALVVTDSQVFSFVSSVVPEEVPLTSFSILMARYKGFLITSLKGAAAIDGLSDGDCILMAEGCTHHRQCGDIGTVKIPNWLRAHTGKDLRIETCSGRDFPEDLSPYALVVHCGGCMITERDVLYRMRCASDQGVPFCNYGIVIAQMNGILERSTRML